MRKGFILWFIIVVIFIAGCSQQKTGNMQSYTIIDWVDFVKLNGQMYSSLYDVIIKDPYDVTDQVVGEVEFRIKDVITDPNYEVQDGDAAFLHAGTKLYKVKGFQPDEVIAAKDESRIHGYRLYLADHLKKSKHLLFDDLSTKKVERIELYVYGEVEPFRILNEDEVVKFMELLNDGEDRIDFDADQTNGDPLYYEMVFYLDEPLAYVHALFDDGNEVFFHPDHTRIVDGEIRKYLQQQVEFIGIVKEWDERTILVAEAGNEVNLIRFTVEEIPENLQEGGKILILFNGIVAESYPGQAKADHVRVLE